MVEISATRQGECWENGGGGDEALNGQLFARSEKYEQIYTEFLAKLGKCYKNLCLKF